MCQPCSSQRQQAGPASALASAILDVLLIIFCSNAKNTVGITERMWTQSLLASCQKVSSIAHATKEHKRGHNFTDLNSLAQSIKI